MDHVTDQLGFPYEGQRDTAAEIRRMSRQCRAILSRLEHSEASNKDLSEISLKYTGRISDLRKLGYQIDCVANDRSTGESWYRLVSAPTEDQPHASTNGAFSR